MKTQIMKQKREILKNRYLPEYGLEVLHLLLVKDKFTHCSFAQNSTPTEGSECKPIENCGQPLDIPIKKVTVHTKKEAVTIYTDKGNVQYLKF